MAYEILSIKMYELDKKISRLQSRIQMSESADHDRIRAEKAELQRECAESETELRNRLRHSRNSSVAVLAESYGEIEKSSKTAVARMENADGKEPEESFPADEKIMFAEYALDFAMQAVNHALLVSMEALDAYMSQQEEQL